jgi:hypothetical protein
MEAYVHEFLQCGVMIVGNGDFLEYLSNLRVHL